MGGTTSPAPGTRTSPYTVQRYPAGDPRRYANQGGVPPGVSKGFGMPPPPAPMPPARLMPPSIPPVARPGPVPLPGPAPRPIIGPPPAPMPPMPYGGPISMPGGPGLPPGVSIGGGPFIPPGGLPSLPTNGQGTGKSGQPGQPPVGIQGGLPDRKDGRDPYLYGPDAGGMPPGPAMSGANNLIDPQTGQPIGLPTNGMGGGKAGANQALGQLGNFATGILGSGLDAAQYSLGSLVGQPNYKFSDSSGPLNSQPNFSNALGTASPLLNTIRR